jgi:hypothetical protein
MSLQIVQQTRAKYPTPLGSSHPHFLLDLITALGPAYGLLRKDGGTHIVLPDGTRVSQDVVTDRAGIQTDCLADGEGAATPVWSAVDPSHYTPDPSRFYRPTSLPEPTPPPQPPSTDLEQRVAALEAWQRDAQFQIVAALRSAEEAGEIANGALALARECASRLDSLRLVPDPGAQAIATSREWGHGHLVRAKIVS